MTDREYHEWLELSTKVGRTEQECRRMKELETLDDITGETKEPEPKT